MTPHDFIAKWRSGGDERRDAQPFFEDLCRLVGHPTPREADPEHTWFTYEYGAAKTSGGDGWADVWKKGFFGWEAKGTDRSLDKAYEQLKMYADALQNPPLLVVSDLRTIVIHTNFTNTVKQVHRIELEQLEDFDTRQLLEAVFHNPDKLRPGITRAAVTQEAADKFTRLATELRDRGHSAGTVAHFLNRLLFCMFAEDIGLLSGAIFTKLVEKSQGNPDLFELRSRALFAAMHSGGDFAMENIEWFNGGLFEDDATLRLADGELKLLLDACRLDWSEIEPSIFGTLFERGLDPDKRSQLGAHYTDPDTIMKLVGPVVVAPWLRAWEGEKAELGKLLAKAQKSVSKPAQDRFNRFLERLRAFTVLDPACGSGNFLYLALRALKDIEKRVLIEAEALGLPRQFPAIGPASVKGIELNAYAAELARVTIWIGEIQWMIQNGYGVKKQPILQPLQQIEHRDALLNADGSEATWPQADAIVGNPPFVGDKKLLRGLGDEYVATLRKVYNKRVPGGADLVCYWFEKANDALRAGKSQRAGLVATNSIRGGKNREVLKHIVDHGRIFEAWSDEDWINEGAAVRVSLICFEGDDAALARHSREGGTSAKRADRPKDDHEGASNASYPVTLNQQQELDSRLRGNDGVWLDGEAVTTIHADLTASTGESGTDLTRALPLASNAEVAFIGGMKKGKFDLDGATTREWLQLPANPNGLRNSVVLSPWLNGMDITRRPSDTWIVDFGLDMPLSDATMFEAPFKHVLQHVKPKRDEVRNELEKSRWWLHARAAPDLRAATKMLARYIGTARVAKHRLFAWMPSKAVIDGQIVVIARDDDTTFGILHSRLHELWSLRMGTSLEDRPRYTPTTCFETFPFPAGLTPDIPAADYASDPRAIRIADAARALVAARDRWLNPPEWTQALPEVVPGFPDRIVARPGFEAELKKRTLTNLYNARPTWLAHLHDALDATVAAAYGWDWPLSDDEVLRRLFVLNQARAIGALPTEPT